MQHTLVKIGLDLVSLNPERQLETATEFAGAALAAMVLLTLLKLIALATAGQG